MIKRNAAIDGSGAEEPLFKKARLKEPSEQNGHDHLAREKGIAPIKAEYGSVLYLQMLLQTDLSTYQIFAPL